MLDTRQTWTGMVRVDRSPVQMVMKHYPRRSFGLKRSRSTGPDRVRRSSRWPTTSGSTRDAAQLDQARRRTAHRDTHRERLGAGLAGGRERHAAQAGP